MIRRNQNYMNILRFLALGDKKLSSFNITHRFTHLFWLGDLNYRVELPTWVRSCPPGARGWGCPPEKRLPTWAGAAYLQIDCSPGLGLPTWVRSCLPGAQGWGCPPENRTAHLGCSCPSENRMPTWAGAVAWGWAPEEGGSLELAQGRGSWRHTDQSGPQQLLLWDSALLP